MKKIILLTFIAVVSLSACKKDKKNTPKSGSELITEILWHTTLEQHQYFDESNTSVFKENNPPGSHYSFANNQVKLTDLKGNVTTGTYAISKNNGKTFIAVTFNGKTENYELALITEEVMTWIQEKTNQTYTQDGSDKIAAKQISTIKFHCPCP